MQQPVSSVKPKKFDKTVAAKQWNKIRNGENEYPSLQSVKKLILEEEKIVAKNFSDLQTALQKREDINASQLEFDLEWFLTWRIKLVVYRTCLWCDGVEIFDVKLLKERKYFLSTEVWFGPESNVNKEYKCKMSGIITVNKSFDKLMNYHFEIDYRTDKIFVIK